ncbi:MAG: hypothetical protein Q4F65_10950 [Propionibacteriaceae bacterium]|nr:hypothetical protein [Propionibacteriaceae bacterium]
MIGEPRDPRARAYVPWIILIVSLGVQLWGLYTNDPPDTEGFGFPGMDLIVHFVLFAVPTWALVKVVPKAWMAVVPMALHVGVSEIIQATLLSERSGEWTDALAGLLGVAVGWWTAVRVDEEERERAS